MSTFTKIGIISKPDDEQISGPVRALYRYLSKRSMQIRVDDVTASLIDDDSLEANTPEQIATNSSLVIAVGGDGTLLHAAHSTIRHEIPLLGINLGRLGFLAEISPGEMETQLDRILAGEFVEEQRFVLQATLIRDGKTYKKANAVNDVVVHAMRMVRMIEIETRVDGQHLDTLRADGYIVSTPTGSTAYALSGGGPILHPNLGAIVLVPICPHTLSNRPIVVDANSRVELSMPILDSRHTALASIDGQINMNFHPGDLLKIEKGKRTLRLIQPCQYDYFDVLQKKLRWNAAPRSKK
ncbi:MAG: NAD(+) kinase [Gammaproteobacteria bacterium]|nr:NAD(+) kinase [Gammaproteobacteria bacterium]